MLQQSRLFSNFTGDVLLHAYRNMMHHTQRPFSIAVSNFLIQIAIYYVQ